MTKDLQMETSIAEAQRDMRTGYYSGATGILASALAWAASATVALLHSPERAVWVLLIAGMLIFPVGLLLCRLLGASGAHSKGNPLDRKSTRLNSSHVAISYAVFCLKKKTYVKKHVSHYNRKHHSMT